MCLNNRVTFGSGKMPHLCFRILRLRTRADHHQKYRANKQSQGICHRPFRVALETTPTGEIFQPFLSRLAYPG